MKNVDELPCSTPNRWASRLAPRPLPSPARRPRHPLPSSPPQEICPCHLRPRPLARGPGGRLRPPAGGASRGGSRRKRTRGSDRISLILLCHCLSHKRNIMLFRVCQPPRTFRETVIFFHESSADQELRRKAGEENPGNYSLSLEGRKQDQGKLFAATDTEPRWGGLLDILFHIPPPPLPRLNPRPFTSRKESLWDEE